MHMDTPPLPITDGLALKVANWKQWAYTDGSCLKPMLNGKPLTQRIGAGVWSPHSQQATYVNSGGQGMTNEINRAELTSILAALAIGHTHIATDSACCLNQIRKQMLHPELQRRHKHTKLLVAIQNHMNNSDTQIHFFIVKAHTGVTGNEFADALARHAAKYDSGHDISAQPVEGGGNPFFHLHWLAAEQHPEDLTQNISLHPLTDMHAKLKAHMHLHHKLGNAVTETGYFSYWKQLCTTKVANKELSNAFWKDASITFRHRKNVMQYRTGTLFNNKIAVRFKLRASSACSICHHPDSALHILSGCQHPTITKIITERHNKAGRLITNAISKGAFGASIVYSDIGSADKLSAEGISLPDDAANRTLPSWLLSRLDDRLRKASSRPDIILVTPSRNCPPELAARKPSEIPKDKREIHLVELKYCEDTRPGPQQAHALEQHARLKQHLHLEGYVAIHLHTILLGVGGTIYNSLTLDPLKALGLDHQHVTKLARKLNAHSITSASSLIGARRKLEANAHQEPQFGWRAAASGSGGRGVGGWASASHPPDPH